MSDRAGCSPDCATMVEVSPDGISASEQPASARLRLRSTLSRIVEAEIAARLSRRQSWSKLSDALRSDVGDDQAGSTAEGVHLRAMAGTVNLIERCYTGFEASGDVARFDPELPAEVRSLSLRLRYRRCWLDVTVTPDRLRIATDEDAPRRSPSPSASGARR